MENKQSSDFIWFWVLENWTGWNHEQVAHAYLQWHSLEQSEQNKYYEMARKEKLLHRQMFPGWSARDNYATQARKKKKREQMNQVNHRLALREEERGKWFLKQI